MSYRYTPSPEFQLIAACCRWPDDGARQQAIGRALTHALALGTSFDWALALKVIDRHRVAGLAHHGLSRHKSQIPASVLSQLEGRAMAQSFSSLQLAGLSKQLVSQLKKSGIEAMVVKGAPLAQLAYGNIALRHSKDCDLAIDFKDMEQAVAVIEAAGYRRRFPATQYTLAELAPVLASLKDFEYYHPATGVQVELQWRMTRSPYQWNHPWLVGEAQSVKIAPQVTLPTLPDSYHLLYLCLHAGVHIWFRLKWLADIEALLNQQGVEARAKLLAQAYEHGLERVVGASLTLGSLIFGAPETPRPKPADWAERALVRRAIAGITAGGGGAEPEDVRFGTTRMSISQYLLRSDWRYLRDQLLIDLAGMEPDSAIEPVWKQAMLRGPRWGWRRMRHGGRKRAQPPKV